MTHGLSKPIEERSSVLLIHRHISRKLLKRHLRLPGESRYPVRLLLIDAQDGTLGQRGEDEENQCSSIEERQRSLHYYYFFIDLRLLLALSLSLFYLVKEVGPRKQ